MQNSKKKNLRRCSQCQAVGHNKARCETTPVPAIPAIKTAPTLRLFVHHVSGNPATSQHIINLKQSHSPFTTPTLPTSAPTRTESLYHSYHRTLERHTNSFASKNEWRAKEFGDLDIQSIPLLKKPSFVYAIGAALRAPFTILKTKIAQRLAVKNRTNQKNSTLATIVRPITVASEPPLQNNTFATERPHSLFSFSNFITPFRLVGAVSIIVLCVATPGPAKSYYQNLRTTGEKVLYHSTTGFGALRETTTALLHGDVAKAREHNTVAINHLQAATKLIEEKHIVLQTIVGAIPFVGSEMADREHLLLAGQAIALGNKQMLEHLGEAPSPNSPAPLQKITTTMRGATEALPFYERAVAYLKNVNGAVLPIEYQEDFKLLTGFFEHATEDLRHLTSLEDALKEMFGTTGRRRYLLVFQNPHELRPTGGFMGSFAVLDIKDGVVVNLEIPPGGSYDLQGQLDTYLVPPLPLTISNKRWEFQDANWFPHFPASAEKILWFYRHSRGVTADGVIAINASVLERLLHIVGPVEDSKRELTLTASTALATLQQVVEYGPEKKAHRPKQIISDAAPVIMEHIKNLPPAQTLQLFSSVLEALDQKEIQAYFSDATAEQSVAKVGWAGEIRPTEAPQDYLLAVNTNLQGGKSDAMVRQMISHQAVIAVDGTITVTAVVTRKHTGTAAMDKLYKQTNINYLRIYVPLGSTLISASGFSWPDERVFRAPEKWYTTDPTLGAVEKEIAIDPHSGTRITEEFGKTAFGNWIITEPGSTSQIQFTYQLPFKAFAEPLPSTPGAWTEPLGISKETSHYQLIVQRQSGAESSFESQIIFPEEWRPLWHQGTNIKIATNGVRIEPIPLQKDEVWSILMKKE